MAGTYAEQDTTSPATSDRPVPYRIGRSLAFCRRPWHAARLSRLACSSSFHRTNTASQQMQFGPDQLQPLVEPQPSQT